MACTFLTKDWGKKIKRAIEFDNAKSLLKKLEI